MKTFGRILAGLAGLIAVILALSFLFLPRRVELTRNVDIARSDSAIYLALSDLRTQSEWSPWYHLDPDAVFTYSGPSSGVGHKSSWKGNEKVGQGSQEIIEAEPYKRIKTKVEISDFGSSTAEWNLVPSADGKLTSVSWTFANDMGPLPWNKLIGALIVKPSVGKDYEKGLAQLKAYVESMPYVDLAGSRVEEVDLPAQAFLTLESSSSQDPAAIGAALGKAYAQIGAVMREARIPSSGHPTSFALEWNDNGVYRFLAAIPVPEGTAITSKNGVQLSQMPRRLALKTAFQGEYKDLHAAGETLAAYARIRNMTPKDHPFDVYVTDPTDPKIQPPITEQYFPFAFKEPTKAASNSPDPAKSGNAPAAHSDAVPAAPGNAASVSGASGNVTQGAGNQATNPALP